MQVISKDALLTSKNTEHIRNQVHFQDCSTICFICVMNVAICCLVLCCAVLYSSSCLRFARACLACSIARCEIRLNFLLLRPSSRFFTNDIVLSRFSCRGSFGSIALKSLLYLSHAILFRFTPYILVAPLCTPPRVESMGALLVPSILSAELIC